MNGMQPAAAPDVPTTSAESHLRAVLTYQLRHREQGLCMLCPRVAVTAHYCERHRRRVNARRRAGTTQWHCQVCHRPGHNRRTCPENRAYQREATPSAGVAA